MARWLFPASLPVARRSALHLPWSGTRLRGMAEVKQAQPGDAMLPGSPASHAGGGAPDEISFEDAIRRLGHIVEQLERGDLPLESSLRLFEEGIGLARVSQRRPD